jgi:hypothetical protein
VEKAVAYCSILSDLTDQDLEKIGVVSLGGAILDQGRGQGHEAMVQSSISAHTSCAGSARPKRSAIRAGRGLVGRIHDRHLHWQRAVSQRVTGGPSMRVILLDIDGVLNCKRTPNPRKFQ